jgi:uncharacterized protein YqgC (DUF456 family)
MDKLSKVLALVWAVLAIASFVCGFFVPIVPKVILIAFGVLNFMIIGSWVIQSFKFRKLKEEEEN